MDTTDHGHSGTDLCGQGGRGRERRRQSSCMHAERTLLCPVSFLFNATNRVRKITQPISLHKKRPGLQQQCSAVQKHKKKVTTAFRSFFLLCKSWPLCTAAAAARSTQTPYGHLQCKGCLRLNRVFFSWPFFGGQFPELTFGHTQACCCFKKRQV